MWLQLVIKKYVLIHWIHKSREQFYREEFIEFSGHMLDLNCEYELIGGNSWVNRSMYDRIWIWFIAPIRPH